MEKEEWRMIPGFEGLYMVSNLGRVKNVKRNRILKPSIVKGYYRVCLSKNNKKYNFFVHRLVAMVFIDNPDNLTSINHKDENPLNNNVDNLEWCTASYNNIYGTRIESMSKKKMIPVCQYAKNGELIKEWSSIKEAQEKYCPNDKGNISACCKGRRKAAYGFVWKYKSL